MRDIQLGHDGAVACVPAATRQNMKLSLCLMLGFLTPFQAQLNGFWIDEQITIRLIQRWDAWEILTVMPTIQPHLPLWYLLPEVAGPPMAILVSILSLPATVYATFRLATSLGGPPAGMRAGLLVAVSPFLAAQASWLRMYAPLTAILTWGLWTAYQRRYRLASACMLLAALIHVWGAFGVAWLAYRFATDGEVTRARLAILVAGLLPAAALLATHVGGDGFTQRSTGVGHAIQPDALRVVLTPISALVGSPHMLLQVLLVLAASGLVLRRWPDPDLAVWVGLPVVGIVAASYLLHPVFRLKYFGFLAPAIAVAATASQRPTWERLAIGALFGALFALSWLQRTVPVITTRRFVFWF